MQEQVSKKAVSFLALIVMVYSLSAVLAWLLDIPFLLNLHGGWEAMKFNTAVCFFLSSIILYFSARAFHGEFDLTQVVILVCAFVVVLLMGTSLLSFFLGIHTGVEELFIKDKYALPQTIAGRPSLPSMLNFLLLAIAGMLTVMEAPKLRLKHGIIGGFICAVGILALSGYVLGQPVLYYYIKDFNGPMALPTAILFILLGTGLCL